MGFLSEFRNLGVFVAGDIVVGDFVGGDFVGGVFVMWGFCHGFVAFTSRHIPSIPSLLETGVAFHTHKACRLVSSHLISSHLGTESTRCHNNSNTADDNRRVLFTYFVLAYKHLFSSPQMSTTIPPGIHRFSSDHRS